MENQQSAGAVPSQSAGEVPGKRRPNKTSWWTILKQYYQTSKLIWFSPRYQTQDLSWYKPFKAIPPPTFKKPCHQSYARPISNMIHNNFPGFTKTNSNSSENSKQEKPSSPQVPNLAITGQIEKEKIPIMFGKPQEITLTEGQQMEANSLPSVYQSDQVHTMQQTGQSHNVTHPTTRHENILSENNRSRIGQDDKTKNASYKRAKQTRYRLAIQAESATVQTENKLIQISIKSAKTETVEHIGNSIQIYSNSTSKTLCSESNSIQIRKSTTTETEVLRCSYKEEKIVQQQSYQAEIANPEGNQIQNTVALPFT